MAGYPANIIAVYPVSGKIVIWNSEKNVPLFSFQQICFQILFVKTIFDFKQFFLPDIWQMKPDIRPITGYQKRPEIRYNPNKYCLTKYQIHFIKSLPTDLTVSFENHQVGFFLRPSKQGKNQYRKSFLPYKRWREKAPEV